MRCWIFIKLNVTVGLSTAPLLATIVILMTIGLLVPGSAQANGRAKLISSQESGPYVIDISLLPGQAVVGTTHISILLRSLVTDDIVTSATVNVSATGPEGSTGFEDISAPNDYTPSFFETDLPFDIVGLWQIRLAVISDLGETTLMVPLEVKEGGRGLNFIMMAALVVIILAVGVFIWGRFPGKGSQKPEES